jgi:hypothetical protein
MRRPTADRIEQIQIDAHYEATAPSPDPGDVRTSIGVQNPSFGYGLRDYFVQWWDLAGQHRETFKKESDARSFFCAKEIEVQAMLDKRQVRCIRGCGRKVDAQWARERGACAVCSGHTRSWR